MNKIWKYKLEVQDSTTLLIPKGARFLSTGLQGSDIIIWILVDPNQTEQESHTIEVYGTGNPIVNNMNFREFLGTVITGHFVWHIFVKDSRER